MAEITKYPNYRVRDDSAQLGTISIVDESGNTLFIRDRTCLGIHEDAYLMAAAPKLAHALEVLLEHYKATVDSGSEQDKDEAYDGILTLVEGALAAASGR